MLINEKKEVLADQKHVQKMEQRGVESAKKLTQVQTKEVGGRQMMNEMIKTTRTQLGALKKDVNTLD